MHHKKQQLRIYTSKRLKICQKAAIFEKKRIRSESFTKISSCQIELKHCKSCNSVKNLSNIYWDGSEDMSNSGLILFSLEHIRLQKSHSFLMWLPTSQRSSSLLLEEFWLKPASTVQGHQEQTPHLGAPRQ